MKASYIWLFLKAVVAVALLATCTTILLAQDRAEHKADKAAHKAHSKVFCSGNFSNGDKAVFREVREMTLPASGTLTVDGGKNGGVRVKGENRSDIHVRACVQTWADSEESARSLAQSIRIGTAGTVKADSATDDGWAVSYEVLVPRNTDLALTTHNGGIAISSVEGRLEFSTTNGGVSLQDVGGDVKGRTTNGGVNVALSGNSWRGNGLDVETSNGGVHLSLPASYAANIETATVNGGFKSDIPALNVTNEDVKGERIGRARGAKIYTSMNGGGAPIRVITTNGGIKISSAAPTIN